MPERASHAALATHFAPDQVTADLTDHSPAESLRTMKTVAHEQGSC
ncbi:hypothetical protein [Streptomyces sp. NPDC057403]